MIWSGLILGLFGSWHCIGMCGPIALMVPGSKGKNRYLAIGLYHIGKILSYVVIGSFFGLFTVFLTSMKVQSMIMIVAGIAIGVIGLVPFLLNYIEKKGFKLFSGFFRLKSKLSKAVNSDRFEYGLYIGFLNGFVPCGLVYMAAMGAMVQASFIHSVLYMVLFGLGTLPLMASFQWLAGAFQNRFSFSGSKMRTIGFILVSGFMIWKGINNYQTEIQTPKEVDNFEVCAIQHPENP